MSPPPTPAHAIRVPPWAVAAGHGLPGPAEAREAPVNRRGSCLSRLHHAPWSRIVFGEEPYLVALLLLVGGFVVDPLLEDAWPLVPVLLLAAALVNAWRWCRESSNGPRVDGEDTP